MAASGAVAALFLVAGAPAGGGSAAPGSTSSRCRPVGSWDGCSSAFPAVRVAALSALTRTSTPSESPTHSGAVEPRTWPEVRSAVPGSAPWSSLWVSTSCQPDQVPVAVARVRTWTLPCSAVSGSSQMTPTREKRCTSPRVRPCSGAAPKVRSLVRGARGSDWVLPGRAGSAVVDADLAPLVDCVAGAGADAADGAADAGRVSGRASAAAQVTPIEEARNPRMPLILDIVIHICLSGN